MRYIINILIVIFLLPSCGSKKELECDSEQSIPKAVDMSAQGGVICISSNHDINLFYPDTGSAQFFWSTGERTSSISPISEGLYSVTVFHDSDSVSRHINLVDCGENAFIPNAISPDNDGINDSWRISAVGVCSVNTIIMDDNGNEIYTSQDINGKWDGKFKGTLVPVGTYSYFVEIAFVSGEVKHHEGMVFVKY